MTFPYSLVLFGLILSGFILSIVRCNISGIPRPKIAIIGSGAGGSSAAYHLSQLLNNDVHIDVFDEKPVIGGRLASVNILGNEYETGGSVIHPQNHLAVELASKHGLSQLKDSFSIPITIYKDSEFIFSTSSWTLITIVKILHRYGLDYNRLESLTNEFISHFQNIYELQNRGLAYDNVESMLSAMDAKLLNLTSTKFEVFLKERGYRQEFIEELVQAITYVNYGQPASIHALVGSISVAGAGNGLWSVQGGNKNLPMTLLNSSNIKVHLNTRIASIIAVPSGSSFKLSTEKTGQNPLPGTYDKIIIAAPLNFKNSLEFVNFADKEAIISEATSVFRNLRYHRTVSTLVAAKQLKPRYKKWMDILSCTPHFFTSISRVHPALLIRSERVPVYKVFSPKPLTSAQLDELFEEIHQIEVADWLAYPEYSNTPPPLPTFQLLPSIYYLNSIEWAASAIEMSLISGRNAAISIAAQINQAPVPAAGPGRTEEPPKKKRKNEL